MANIARKLQRTKIEEQKLTASQVLHSFPNTLPGVLPLYRSHMLFGGWEHWCSENDDTVNTGYSREPTLAQQVGRSLVTQDKAYENRDDLPLATQQQVSPWNLTYEELAGIKCKMAKSSPVGGRLVQYVKAWQHLALASCFEGFSERLQITIDSGLTIGSAE